MAQRHLEAGRDEILDIIRLLPDVLFRCHKGPDGKIYWSFNEGRLAEEFGLTTDEIRGKPLEELFPGGASEHIKAEFEAAFAGEAKEWTNEIEGRHFRHFPQPIFGPDGKVSEVVGFITEVTSLVEAERRVRDANADLEAFTHAVSHDLRTPLAAMANHHALLKRQISNGETEAALATLAKTGRIRARMAETLDSLLALSRAGRGEPPRRVPVNLSAVATSVLEVLAAKDPDHQVTTRVEGGLQAEMDPALARTLLENLIGNAWKFTKGKVGPTITFRAGPKPGEFEVIDNGPGFPPGDAERIFQPFQRAHVDIEGSGVGLATVQRIITHHGGNVHAHGRPGHGATFTFTVAPQSDEAGATRPPRPSP